jgi:hypothetical protein
VQRARAAALRLSEKFVEPANNPASTRPPAWNQGRPTEMHGTANTRYHPGEMSAK